MEIVPIPDGELAFEAHLTLPLPPDEVLARLVNDTDWRQETITVFGKRHLQPAMRIHAR